MSGLTERHAQWLERRKLDVEVAEKLGVTSRGPGVAFPYVLNGQKLYDKVRDPESKANTRCVPSGIAQTSLFNEDCLNAEPNPTDAMIITEGEPDTIAVLQLGYQFVVSLPSGASSTPDGCRSKALKCLTIAGEDGNHFLKADIEKFKKVVILTDGDHDGLLMRKAIVDIIGDEFASVCTYPEGTKDANDVLIAHGADALRAMIEGAVPVMSDGYLDFIEAEKFLPTIKALKCGIPFLDDHFKPVCPSLIVIGGQGGHGKSTITQAVLYSMLYANPHLKASIFHAEGDKKIPVKRARLFWKGVVNPLHMTTVQIAERDTWIKERLAFISPPQGEMPTFKWLIKAMEHQALYRKRNVFVIDPWNQVLHDTGRQSKTDYIGDRIYDLKRLAETYRLIIIVAHHTTKAVDPRQPPGRYDLADSAHWVNAADHQIMVWKPYEDQNATRVEIVKSKDHETMGRPGEAWVTLRGDKYEAFTINKVNDPRPKSRRGDAAAPADKPLPPDQSPEGAQAAPPSALDTLSDFDSFAARLRPSIKW